MSAKVIDGAALAERVKLEVKRRVEQLAASGRRPALAAVLIGSTPAGELYASRQAQACGNVGIAYHLHKLAADTTQAAAERELQLLALTRPSPASCFTFRCRPIWTPPNCNTRSIPSRTLRASILPTSGTSSMAIP